MLISINMLICVLGCVLGPRGPARSLGLYVNLSHGILWPVRGAGSYCYKGQVGVAESFNPLSDAVE